MSTSKFSTVFMSNDAFKKYWHATSMWWGYSFFFSVVTLCYLIQKISILPREKLSDPTAVARIVLSTVVLVLLPFASSYRYKYFFVTATSVVLLACIINLEGVFERRQSFVSLYIMSIFYRTTRDHTFFDNFALCIAYSADVASITHRNLDWYVRSNLALWAYFFIALFFNNLYKQTSLRVWEAVRALIILREKTKNEHARGESLVAAHLPKDIMEYAFRSNNNNNNNNTTVNNANLQSSASFSSLPTGNAAGTIARTESKTDVAFKALSSSAEDNRTNTNTASAASGVTATAATTASAAASSTSSSATGDAEQKNATPAYSEKIERFLSAAVQSGVVREFDAGSVSPAMLKALSRVDKRGTVLIGAKVDKGNAKDCALAVDREHKVHALLDLVAKKHRLTSVRRFGNTWIGTLGYFQSFSDDNLNCYQALLFCSEMDSLAKNMGMKLAFVVDFGSVVGGFVTSFQFDIFGQEMRWVLKMVDLNDYGRIIISESVRQMLHVHKRTIGANEPFPLFDKKHSEVNGKRIAYTLVTNPQELVKPRDVIHAHSQQQQHSQQWSAADLETRDDFSEHLVDGSWRISFDPAAEKRASEARRSSQRRASASATVSSSNISLSSRSLADYESEGSLYSPFAPLLRTRELVSFIDPDYWREEDARPELHLSLLDKFDISAEDAVLAKFSAEDLAETHRQVEEEVYRELRRTFFPNVFETIRTYIWSWRRGDSLLLTSLWSATKRATEEAKKSCAEAKAELARIGEVYEDPWELYSSQQWRWHGLQELFSLLEGVPVFRSLTQRWLARRKYDVLSSADDELQRSGSGSNTANGTTLHKSESLAATASLENADNGAVQSNSNGIANNNTTNNSTNNAASSEVESENTGKETVAWPAYALGSKLLIHNILLNFAVDTFFFLTSLYPIRVAMLHEKDSDVQMNTTFVNLIFVHFVLSQTLEKMSPRLGGVLLAALHCLIIALAPCSMIERMGAVSSSGFGDFGGDASLLLFFTFRIPSYLHQTGAVALVDILASRAILLLRTTAFSSSSSGGCYMPGSGRVSTTLVLLMLVACYFAVEHRCLVAYLLEHRLLPRAIQHYRRQRENSRELLCTFSPAQPGETDEQRGGLKWYRNSVVVAIHIKACDVISGLVDARDVAKLARTIGGIIDRSFQEFGMLKVTNFSGVYMAMICRSMGKETWDRSGAGASSPYASHVLYLVRTIHARVEKFSKDHNFNVALGIALNHGSAYVGFLGNGIYCFDVAGPTRDLAVTMACHHGEGIFAPRVFEADIHRIMPSDDLVHHQKISDEADPDSYWLMLDGNFSGMQLDDFTYIGMLGRGGYGSVHLVSEKSTNTQYAVKAIALRQGSVMSKMIKRECIILQKMQHPNVVNLKYSFISNSRLYLVMSFIKGGNLKLIMERAPVEFPQLRYWFAELVLAIEYVHSVGIIHRDIKPANCMIGTDGHLKLGDFGLSKTIAHTKESVSRADAKSVDSLGFGDEVYSKLQNFLPLKSHFLQGTRTQSVERKVSVLLVKSDLNISEARKTLVFRNLSIEAYVVKSRNDAEFSLSKNNIDAIFIEVSDSEEQTILDAIQLLQFFCSNLFNTIPVYLLRTPQVYRPMFVESGAKDCLSATFDQLDEETLRRIFAVQTVPLFASSSQQQQQQQQSSVSSTQTAASEPSRTGVAFNTLSNAQVVSTTGGGTMDPVATTNATAVLRPTANAESRHEHTAHSKSADQDHIVGTVHFIAPEVIRVRRYGKPVDWWACGVTFYECVMRQHLFKGEDKEAIFESILNLNVDFSALDNKDPHVRDLIKGLVCHDVTLRLGTNGTEAIRNHSFFASIDWETVSTNNELNFRPSQFLPKFDLKDKLQFYGETENRDKQVASSKREMDQRNINSLRRYNQNRVRLRNARKKPKNGPNRPFMGQRMKALISGQIAPERKPRRTGNSSSFGASGPHSYSDASLSNGGESDSLMFSYETVHEDDCEDSEADELEHSMPITDLVHDFRRKNSTGNAPEAKLSGKKNEKDSTADGAQLMQMESLDMNSIVEQEGDVEED